MKTRIDSVDDVTQSFARQGYICDQRTALAVYLAAQLHKPVLVEGPGVGKTELAKAAAGFLEAPLIRLQCYEGLDESRALYEWKYGKQLLYTQLLRDKLSGVLADTESLEQSMHRLGDLGDAFYSETFLEPRPLLRALRAEEPVVLLIDEIDKADQEFEAFLLELLSDFQISIPEMGTVRARHQPLVFLTSNDQRSCPTPSSGAVCTSTSPTRTRLWSSAFWPSACRNWTPGCASNWWNSSSTCASRT